MSNGAILYMCDLGIISFDAVAAIIKLTLLSPSYSTSEDIFQLTVYGLLTLLISITPKVNATRPGWMIKVDVQFLTTDETTFYF